MLVPGWVTILWCCSSNIYNVGYEPKAEKQLSLAFSIRLFSSNSGLLHRSFLLKWNTSGILVKILYSFIFKSWLLKNKKCRPRYGQSRGTMQRQRSCQNSCSIHVYVVPTAVCTPVLYTLIVTVQLSFLLWPIGASHPSRGHQTPHGHRGHQTDTTQSQMLSSGSPTKKKDFCRRCS